MIKIGLTGGIASGKSTVAKWFRNQGVVVFDADQAVHTIYIEDQVISSIVEAFGEEFLLKDGTIDRSALAQRVFRSHQERKKLEQILHPLVRERIRQAIQEAQENHEKIIILEIPLLFEGGFESECDEIWVVYVPEASEIHRLMMRNELSAEEAKRRIMAQMSLEEKAKKATRIIDNSGSWEETERQLLLLWVKLQELYY